MKKFVIIHGTKGSPEGNWFPWLAEVLRHQHAEVVTPRLPTPDGQNLANWLSEFSRQVGVIDEGTTLIGHSLGATFLLRILERQKAPVLVLLVPSNPTIYSGLDEELGHYRRYTREELMRVLGVAGFEVNNMISHNLVGALGWWWAGKVRGRRTLRANDTKNFDKLVPLLKHIDPFITKPFGGVSLIALASPKAESTTIIESSNNLGDGAQSEDALERYDTEGRIDA